MIAKAQSNFVSTRNACKLCSPLGACVVFRGIEGGIPLLHGSQGCATYIRRYVISHFREPIDVASSNFSEQSAVFGGERNLHTALRNVTKQYRPALIGIATTCLSETIGDDVPMILNAYRKENSGGDSPALVHVSTPSYRGTHMDGFHGAVRAVADALADGGETLPQINLFPGFVSAADLRQIKRILRDMGVSAVLLPDYSQTLDGPSWSEYEKLQAGGTPVAAIRSMGRSAASIEFGPTMADEQGAAQLLEKKFSVKRLRMGLPIGVAATDAFFDALRPYAKDPAPAEHELERGQLVDAYVDGHKYVFGKRAIVYGEEDLVAAMAGFLAEIGIVPVLCASGGQSGRLPEAIAAAAPQLAGSTKIRQGVDFLEIAEEAKHLAPDLLIGGSKGYSLSRSLGVPLVRVGFPIHDRIGGQRVEHLGYRGTQQLFDRIVNTLLEAKQESSDVGYSYM